MSGEGLKEHRSGCYTGASSGHEAKMNWPCRNGSAPLFPKLTKSSSRCRTLQPMTIFEGYSPSRSHVFNDLLRSNPFDYLLVILDCESCGQRMRKREGNDMDYVEQRFKEIERVGVKEIADEHDRARSAEPATKRIAGNPEVTSNRNSGTKG
jgi:hypothetical protein